MVETRSRRKSVAPAAAAPGGGSEAGAAPGAAPSGSGQPQGAAGAAVDYAEMYRQAHLRHLQEEQASILRRLKGHVQLFYHQQAMTWGWYMLEPWETMLWMCILALLTYFVLGRGLSSCVIDSHSMCRSSLAAVRDAVAAGGAKLLDFTR